MADPVQRSFEGLKVGFDPEAERKIALVEGLLDRAREETERLFDEAMDRLEREWFGD